VHNVNLAKLVADAMLLVVSYSSDDLEEIASVIEEQLQRDGLNVLNLPILVHNLPPSALAENSPPTFGTSERRIETANFGKPELSLHLLEPAVSRCRAHCSESRTLVLTTF
jgi:hypothetical protein